MKKVLLASIVASLLFVGGCGRIETGYVGIRTEFNKTVQTVPMNPGFYTAFLSHVDEYVVKEIEVKFDNLTPKGKDNLVLSDFDVSIWYQPNAAKIGDMAVKYAGMSAYSDGHWYPAFNLVERVARGAIFDVVSQYDSLTIHTKRAELENGITTAVQKELEMGDKGAFTVTKIVVRQIKTDPALEKSIQVAVQMQKQTEAKNLEVDLAKAEAKRLYAEAEGLAKANEKIASSITQQLIDLKKAEAMKECATNAKCTMIFGNATPIIDTRNK